MKEYFHHLQRVLGDEANDKWIDCEYLIRKKLGADDFDRLKKRYEKYLSSHPEAPDIQRRLIIADDVIINILGIYPSNVKDLIPNGYHHYYPICTVEEIDSIASPRSTFDLLLKVRGKAAADNVRLHRVLLAKYNLDPQKWSLTSYFSTTEFNKFLRLLSPKEQAKCSIMAGFAFTTDPNGACIKSDFGNYIVISEALRYFLFFMNIFHLGSELSLADRMTCLLIAARVMYYYEQLDFELDPRGTIPRKLEKQVNKVTQDQIQFVIGHEYFHHILNHLDDNSTTKINLLPTSEANTVTIFNYSQIQELQADFASIHRPNYSRTDRNELLNAAFLFFMSLDLFSCIKEYYSPSGLRYKTHPEPLDRMWELRKKISPKFGMSTDQINNFLYSNDIVKKHLHEEWLPFNVEQFEMVGSYYLSSYVPGKRLDRIHY